MSISLVPPMLASSGSVPGDVAGWSYEVRWDGWRALVYLDGAAVKVRTRAGRQVADALPELIGLVDALDGHPAILDGELIVCSDGRPDFYALGPRMACTGRHAAWMATRLPVTFVAFDLLHLDGEDLTGRPLLERKRLLDDLRLVGPTWATNGWYRRLPEGVGRPAVLRCTADTDGRGMEVYRRRPWSDLFG